MDNLPGPPAPHPEQGCRTLRGGCDSAKMGAAARRYGDKRAGQPTNPSTRGTSTAATSSTVTPGTASATHPTLAGSHANSSAA